APGLCLALPGAGGPAPGLHPTWLGAGYLRPALMAAPPLPTLPDLHRHLDGSLPPATVSELAARPSVAVPPGLAFRPGMGLEGALSRFAFTLSLIQEPAEVRRIASEICEDAAREGVTTLEVRFAPQLHRPPLEGIVDAALDGLAGRAGLILC